MAIAEEQLRRIVDRIETGFRHAKHADLVNGPEAVLRCAQHSMVECRFALEIEHGIDDVLERFRSSNSAAFRDMPDDEHCRSTLLREAHQARGTLAHLADIARRPFEIGGEHRLNRVDDER